MTRRRDIVILGSTGSIGTQALDIVAAHPELFRVVGLSAGGGNPELLARQVREFDVPTVGIAEGTLDVDARVVVGPQASTEIAALPCHTVLNGITGAVGLEPSLAALRSGAVLALANKESLIVGGPLVKELAGPGQLVPVDSEHSALAQCLRSGSAAEVDRLILTASGGPFRGWTRDRLAQVSVTEALQHPTWDMGPVVTINSATLMNKGLEVIEAHLLFDVPLDRIDVVVHPQSIVHSMVRFVDGSTMVQASPPDMHLPIALGLGWPDRVPGASTPCDWTVATSWHFEPLDEVTFPAVALARNAARTGGTAPAVYNAANEVAVAAFREGRLSFPGITEVVDRVLSASTGAIPGNRVTLESVWDADGAARRAASQLIEEGTVV